MPVSLSATIPLTHAPKTTLPRRLLLCIALGSAATLTHAADPEWPAPARAGCADDYGDARCDDWRFLQNEYAPESLDNAQDVARRAGIRKNRAEKRALQEVMLKYTGLCDIKPEQYCGTANRAACIAQLQQSCAVIQRQTASCETQTKQYCAQQNQPRKCLQTLAKRCTHEDLSIDQILAKYPELTEVRKARLKQAAIDIEKNSDKSLLGSLASGFLKLLGFSS